MTIAKKTNEAIIPCKHNYKLSEDDRKAIVLEYTLNKNKQTVKSLCNKFTISERTLYEVLSKYNQKQKNEIVNESIKEYKKNFSKNANLIINKAFMRLNEKLEEENADNININQLSTTIGILYDKTRLEDNLSTSNNSVSINIKID